MNTGAYQLHIEISKDCLITIGRKGRFRFKKGQYIYSGSSMTNLDKRIARHLSTDKKLHWHIDYLLAHPSVRVVRVERFESPIKIECELNQRVQHTPGALAPVPRFGAGDCTSSCAAHLFRLPPGTAMKTNMDVSDESDKLDYRINSSRFLSDQSLRLRSGQAD